MISKVSGKAWQQQPPKHTKIMMLTFSFLFCAPGFFNQKLPIFALMPNESKSNLFALLLSLSILLHPRCRCRFGFHSFLSVLPFRIFFLQFVGSSFWVWRVFFFNHKNGHFLPDQKRRKKRFRIRFCVCVCVCAGIFCSLPNFIEPNRRKQKPKPHQATRCLSAPVYREWERKRAPKPNVRLR